MARPTGRATTSAGRRKTSGTWGSASPTRPWLHEIDKVNGQPFGEHGGVNAVRYEPGSQQKRGHRESMNHRSRENPRLAGRSLAAEDPAHIGALAFGPERQIG